MPGRIKSLGRHVGKAIHVLEPLSLTAPHKPIASAKMWFCGGRWWMEAACYGITVYFRVISFSRYR
jgi:hypothetical protein